MLGSAYHLSPDAAAHVRVSAEGPFAVSAITFRDAQGRLTCTVVAKATYELAPGECAPIEPIPIQEQDSHWDDDPSRSVNVPSDLSPFKQAAEVVVVGSAFAATLVPSLLARVLVGSVDKSVEATSARHFRQDGTVSPGVPARRFSLRYERAAGGGPGTENPSGIDTSRADGMGRRPVPQLLPPYFSIGGPDDHVPIVGLGPLAPTWPLRAGLLGPSDRAWLRDPTRGRLPPSFPARFFQSAPPDQWLDRALAPNERLVLEGLHPEVGRLVMSLSGMEPRALVAGARVAEPSRFVADLLVIDTDRSICTLTYRMQIPLAEGGPPLRVVVVGAAPGDDVSPVDAEHILSVEAIDFETTNVEGIMLSPPPTGSTGKLGLWNDRPVLPFAVEPTRRGPQPSHPDSALPFRPADPVTPIPPPVPAPPMVRVPSPVPTIAVSPAPPPIPAAPPPFVDDGGLMRSSGALPPPKPLAMIAPEPPQPLVRPVPPAPMSQPVMTAPPAAPSRPSLPDPPRRAPLPSASFDSAFGGAKAASDAAARAAAPDPPAPKEPFGPPLAAGPAKSTAVEDDGKRQAVVSLLCFETAILPRLRTTKRFAAALASRPKAKRAPGLDEPRKDEPTGDRSDVLRVLSCGRPADASEIHRALADGLDDLDDLDPPLVLVAGELRPTFDELEALRTTVAVVQQVAGGDKKILAAVAVGQEALAAPVAPRPETTLGLVRQIEQAASSLSLPARYVPSEVERLLIEGRKYKRRPLLGAPRVRADLTVARGGEVLPLYLPDSAASSLPLLPAFPIVALCQVTPREDLCETQDEALFVQALGRVLRSRG